MGLLLEDGTASAVSITALSLAFAGLLLDDACDFYQNYARAQDEFQCLFAAAEHAGGRQRFLPVCRQYHELCRPLPDPVWWISGNPLLPASLQTVISGICRISAVLRRCRRRERDTGLSVTGQSRSIPGFTVRRALHLPWFCAAGCPWTPIDS